MLVRQDHKLPQEILFLIHSKAFSFQEEGIQKVNAEDVKDYIFDILWQDKEEMELCDMIDDIMNIQFSSFYDYMSAKAITSSKHKTLEDFDALILK